MQRWVLEQNIARFKQLLTLQQDAASRLTLRSLLIEAERELALLDAGSVGARPGSLRPAPVLGSITKDARDASRFRRDFEDSPHLYLLLDPRPGLHIVDANVAYSSATMIDRAVVAGQRLFDVFPDNPDDPFADGVNKLFASLRIAAGSGLRHTMKAQKYDVKDQNGVFVERFWRVRNSPILSEGGHLLYLLHHVEDVTAEVRRDVSPDEVPTRHM